MAERGIGQSRSKLLAKFPLEHSRKMPKSTEAVKGAGPCPGPSGSVKSSKRLAGNYMQQIRKEREEKRQSLF